MHSNQPSRGLGPQAQDPSRPKPDPKQDRAVRTRSQILQAAATAFSRKGFPAVTVHDVAELTGMTKGAVYFHYANKEALAIAVVEEFYRRWPPMAAAVRQLDVTPLDMVRELMMRTAFLLRDDKVAQAGARLQAERAFICVALPTPFEGYTTILVDLLTQAEEQGQLPAGATPETLARVLFASLFGAQHISWILNDRADLPERIAEVIDAVIPRSGS